jgi:hypothetical protein
LGAAASAMFTQTVFTDAFRRKFKPVGTEKREGMKMGFQCVPQNTNRPTNQQATGGKLKWSEAGDWENGGEGANGHKAFGFLAAESVRWRETLNAQCAALPGGRIYIKKGQGV